MANASLQNVEQYVEEVEDGFKCGICDKIFKKRGGINRHIRDVHIATKHIKCRFEDCDSAFKYYNVYRRHLVKEHGEGKMECPIPDCPYKATDINL